MSPVTAQSRRKDAVEEAKATVLFVIDDTDEIIREMCESILSFGVRLKRKAKARLIELDSVLREVS